MVTFGQDSDIVEWFLGYDPYYPSGYNFGIIQEDSNTIYDGQYFRGYDDAASTNVENDEIIARTLQEDFSQLELTETHENPYGGEEHLQLSINGNDWHSLPARNYASEWGNQGSYYNESEDLLPSNSCASPSDSEEYSCLLELSDDDALDDEVGKRLNQMTLIPHIPRINGDIPSTDEAVSDHERLLNRIELYGFVEHRVQGDGNCQYGVKILVMTSFKDTCYIEILPLVQKSKGVIFLSFWAEVHYNSIYFQGGKIDIPSNEFRKKTKWWSFLN